MKYQNSYLQWAGGKNKVLPYLLPILNNYWENHLCEPFVGAGNVALNYKADFYTLVDINEDLINSHQIVLERPEWYVGSCQKLFGLGFDPYYDLRDKFNQSEDIYDRVVLFQYLNKHGFNGLCRYNKKGEFNTPKGTVKKKGCNVPVTQIEAFSRLLKDAKFICDSFENYFDFNQPTLIYCDPPYVPMTANNFKYSAEGFDYGDQVRLRDLAKHSKHTVVISNHWNNVTQELYKDADEIHVVDVQRTISCKGSERVRVQECIVVYLGEDSKKIEICPVQGYM